MGLATTLISRPFRTTMAATPQVHKGTMAPAWAVMAITGITAAMDTAGIADMAGMADMAESIFPLVFRL